MNVIIIINIIMEIIISGGHLPHQLLNLCLIKRNSFSGQDRPPLFLMLKNAPLLHVLWFRLCPKHKKLTGVVFWHPQIEKASTVALLCDMLPLFQLFQLLQLFQLFQLFQLLSVKKHECHHHQHHHGNHHLGGPPSESTS